MKSRHRPPSMGWGCTTPQNNQDHFEGGAEGGGERGAQARSSSRCQGSGSISTQGGGPLGGQGRGALWAQGRAPSALRAGAPSAHGRALSGPMGPLTESTQKEPSHGPWQGLSEGPGRGVYTLMWPSNDPPVGVENGDLTSFIARLAVYRDSQRNLDVFLNFIFI